jgi:hypothetical protein
MRRHQRTAVFAPLRLALSLLLALALLPPRALTAALVDNTDASACLVVFMTGTPERHADSMGAYALQAGNATGGRPAYYDAGNKQWLYFEAGNSYWRIGPTLGRGGDYRGLFTDDAAQTPDAITATWVAWGGWPAPSVRATCGAPPPPPPHAPVLVDNTDASAADAPGCGVGGAASCRTIGYGVRQALAQAASGALPAVRVQGGGVPYRGECGSVTGGIFVPGNASLAVVGLNASRGGALVGAPVIDCEGNGRAFFYMQFVEAARAMSGRVTSAPAVVGAPAGAAAVGGAGVRAWRGSGAAAPQLVLEGLVVRNGHNAGGGASDGSGGAVCVWGALLLLLRRCTFENCSASFGGGAVAVTNSVYGSGEVDVRGAVLVAEDSNFTRCSSSNSGGGAVLVFLTGPFRNVAITLSGCGFEDSAANSTEGGGAVLVMLEENATIVSVTITDCLFTGCSAVGSGGAVAVTHAYGWIATASTAITDSTFKSCSTKAGDGGAVAVTHLGVVTGSSMDVTGSQFKANMAGGVGGALALSAPAGSTGVALKLARSGFYSNKADGAASSGGALYVAFPEEAPLNLGFVGNPASTYLPSDFNKPCSSCSSFPSCRGCPVFSYPEVTTPLPVIPREHVFRLWDYTTPANSFALSDSGFRNNSATLSGGALMVVGGGAAVIAGCKFEKNDAKSFFGGGAAIAGTVQLNVSRSVWHGNQCGLGGCQIYSSSGAGVRFSLNSSVELGCGDKDGSSCRAGVAAAQSGTWTWDASSGMSCKPGFELVNSSVLAYSATLDGWQLRAPIVSKCGPDVVVVKNVTNCPCYFGNLNSGFGIAAVVSPKMLVSALSYACRPCAAGSYSLAQPSLGGAAAVNAICAPCPHGGNCSGGSNVAAVPGFWGSNSSSSSNSSAVSLTFVRCPSGYCCDGAVTAATPCISIGGCAGNRNGTLCGECALGFAQTIGSVACRIATECGGTDAALFVPGALLLATLFVLYALHAPAGGGGGGFPLNAIQPTIYYYQMAQLLPVGTPMGGAVLSLLAGLFNMQLHVNGGDGFACPFAALTTLQAIELHYAVPALVVLALAIGYCAEARKQQPPRETKARTGGGGGGVRRRYEGALVKVATLAYSTVLSTTFQLLHCVDVSGVRVLFRAATIECDVWQAPFYALAFALLLPVAAAFAAAAGVGTACTPALPAPLAAKLCAPFREGCDHWEAVLALHRLSVVAVCSFGGTNSAVAAVLQTILCGVALMVQTLWQPFRERSANRAQTVLLVCLVVVALLNVPQAILDTNARAESDQMARLVRQLQGGEAVLLLAPAALVGVALLALAWRRRCDLVAAAGAGCAALAHCSCAFWACVAGECAAADEEAPLDEPLLPNHSSSVSGSGSGDGDSSVAVLGSSKLVCNSRGLRLTNRTPAADDDEQDKEDGQ